MHDCHLTMPRLSFYHALEYTLDLRNYFPQDLPSMEFKIKVKAVSSLYVNQDFTASGSKE
jgi:hypothetical protein